jgi:hypothetical protein
VVLAKILHKAFPVAHLERQQLFTLVTWRAMLTKSV